MWAARSRRCGINLGIRCLGRIHREIACERTAQRFIGSDQRAQALVDLAIFPLAALLYRLHRKQPDADSDEGNHAEPEQSRKQRLPRSEI